jgi:D-erythro-7,8-dihydroneopterin triphosphate epimerase
MSSAITRITNLRLNAIIGCNDWERGRKQKVIINVNMEFNPTEAIASDSLDKTLDYRKVKKQIITAVTASSFNLRESLTARILEIIMSHSRVETATVTVDKPKALRYADSVSVTLSTKRK